MPSLFHVRGVSVHRVVNAATVLAVVELMRTESLFEKFVFRDD